MGVLMDGSMERWAEGWADECTTNVGEGRQREVIIFNINYVVVNRQL